jgi:hypothetical protein
MDPLVREDDDWGACEDDGEGEDDGRGVIDPSSPATTNGMDAPT